jgi:uncharacterized membrane protein
MTPRHGAFFVGLATGAIVAVASIFFAPSYAVVFGSLAMFVAYLAAVAVELGEMTPDVLKRHADEEDVPIGVIAVVTLGIVGVSTFSLFMALNGGSKPDPIHVWGGVAAVILGWFVIHTMAALHYAYEFYESPQQGTRGKAKASDIAGGLEWAEEGEPPDGVGFIYFSYQIGSAVQVSDVRSTTNKMRALIVAHATFAFFYNTMLVAAAVNVVITLAGGGG